MCTVYLELAFQLTDVLRYFFCIIIVIVPNVWGINCDSITNRCGPMLQLVSFSANQQFNMYLYYYYFLYTYYFINSIINSNNTGVHVLTCTKCCNEIKLCILYINLSFSLEVYKIFSGPPSE